MTLRSLTPTSIEIKQIEYFQSAPLPEKGITEKTQHIRILGNIVYTKANNEVITLESQIELPFNALALKTKNDLLTLWQFCEQEFKNHNL